MTVELRRIDHLKKTISDLKELLDELEAANAARREAAKSPLKDSYPATHSRTWWSLKPKPKTG